MANLALQGAKDVRNRKEVGFRPFRPLRQLQHVNSSLKGDTTLENDSTFSSTIPFEVSLHLPVKSCISGKRVHASSSASGGASVPRSVSRYRRRGLSDYSGLPHRTVLVLPTDPPNDIRKNLPI